MYAAWYFCFIARYMLLITCQTQRPSSVGIQTPLACAFFIYSFLPFFHFYLIFASFIFILFTSACLTQLNSAQAPLECYTF